MATLYHRPAMPSQHDSHDVADSARRGSASSLFSSTDEDMITPCPLKTTVPRCQYAEHVEEAPSMEQRPQPHTERPKSWRCEESHFNPLDIDDVDNTDPTELWRTMLAIQRTFGFYNSARMRAAIELGDVDVPVPSRTCLNLLNDSIAQLPEEARRRLDEFLNSESSPRRRSSSSWRHRLLHGPA